MPLLSLDIPIPTPPVVVPGVLEVNVPDETPETPVEPPQPPPMGGGGGEPVVNEIVVGEPAPPRPEPETPPAGGGGQPTQPPSP